MDRHLLRHRTTRAPGRRAAARTDGVDLPSESGPALAFDLRDYVDDRARLTDHLAGVRFTWLWARGGNTFLLRHALAVSGGDEVLNERLARDVLLGARGRLRARAEPARAGAAATSRTTCRRPTCVPATFRRARTAGPAVRAAPRLARPSLDREGAGAAGALPGRGRRLPRAARRPRKTGLRATSSSRRREPVGKYHSAWSAAGVRRGWRAPASRGLGRPLWRFNFQQPLPAVSGRAAGRRATGEPGRRLTDYPPDGGLVLPLRVVEASQSW